MGGPRDIAIAIASAVLSLCYLPFDSIRAESVHYIRLLRRPRISSAARCFAQQIPRQTSGAPLTPPMKVLPPRTTKGLSQPSAASSARLPSAPPAAPLAAASPLAVAPVAVVTYTHTDCCQSPARVA